MDVKGLDAFGFSVYRKETPVETPEELEARLERDRMIAEYEIEIDKLKRESLYKIESKEKRRTVMLWSAAASFLVAVLGIVFGAVTHGWKTGAAISAGGTLLGTLILSLIGLITPIAWGIALLLVVLAVRGLYLIKHKGFKTVEE